MNLVTVIGIIMLILINLLVSQFYTNFKNNFEKKPTILAIFSCLITYSIVLVIMSFGLDDKNNIFSLFLSGLIMELIFYPINLLYIKHLIKVKTRKNGDFDENYVADEDERFFDEDINTIKKKYKIRKTIIICITILCGIFLIICYADMKDKNMYELEQLKIENEMQRQNDLMECYNDADEYRQSLWTANCPQDNPNCSLNNNTVIIIENKYKTELDKCDKLYK